MLVLSPKLWPSLVDVNLYSVERHIVPKQDRPLQSWRVLSSFKKTSFIRIEEITTRRCSPIARKVFRVGLHDSHNLRVQLSWNRHGNFVIDVFGIVIIAPPSLTTSPGKVIVISKESFQLRSSRVLTPPPLPRHGYRI